ncbi:hypothetical protein Bca4012_063276 [Brassica carinata]
MALLHFFGNTGASITISLLRVFFFVSGWDRTPLLSFMLFAELRLWPFSVAAVLRRNHRRLLIVSGPRFVLVEWRIEHQHMNEHGLRQSNILEVENM